MSERTDTERIEGIARLGVDLMSNADRDVVCTYVRHKGDVELLRQAIDAAIDAGDPDSMTDPNEHPTEEAWRCPWCGVGLGACCEPSPKPPPDLRCTRDPGHKGRHVACGREPADVQHEPLAVWGKP